LCSELAGCCLLRSQCNWAVSVLLQIWLNLLVDDLQCGNITKLEKKKKKTLVIQPLQWQSSTRGKRQFWLQVREDSARHFLESSYVLATSKNPVSKYGDFHFFCSWASLRMWRS
jgi:hypothetical protein